jgi:hypothetical protein
MIQELRSLQVLRDKTSCDLCVLRSTMCYDCRDVVTSGAY